MHPRRRQLAGARVRRGGRCSVLRGARPRGGARGQRGPDLRRLRPVLGRVDPRARGSAHRGGGPAGGGRRHVVRRADGTRGRAGRSDRGAGREHREGAAGLERHRSGDDRGAARTRRDRTDQDPEVRGLLPRSPGCAARGGRQWPRDPGHPGLGGGHARRGRRHRRRSVQRHPRGRRRVRRARLRGGAGRAGRRQHGARPARRRVPRLPAEPVHRGRGAARPRRGDHRLPRGARRRAGVVRDHTGPDDPRQGGGRRSAARRRRRTGGGHGPPRAARTRVPGRHALREPARDRRGPRRARRAGRGGLRHAHREGRCPAHRPRPGVRRGPDPGAGDAGHDPRWAVLLTPAGHRLRRRPGGGPRAVRPLLPRHARSRRVPRAERLRDAVRLASRTPTRSSSRPSASPPRLPRPCSRRRVLVAGSLMRRWRTWSM